ncbi:GtrA family protein [Rhodococcus hoagii]|uniref:GtrA family protein n=2 Tax=Rhodococcus hoagii TaxID=43767 RepID=A0A9Q5A2I7_RHOHA|nr:GtrA family protein [Prescottella equi]MBM4490283.1 GtrA family protein [Prescottella equi]MBM4501354.1 GtrA family protein [Prescottella equi]MBM4504210.1 GtrA family protein [Prescottella equi]MBM4507659.1 GtrA family protein [Prescottella equi]
MMRHILRFGVVGVVNTGVYYALYLVFNTVMPYLAAHLLAIAISMVGSFFLNCYWTFRTRPTWRKFALFPLTNATNYIVTTVGMVLLVTFLGVDDRIAPLIAAVAAIPVTFLLSRRILTHQPASTVTVVETADGRGANSAGSPTERH